MGDRDILVAGGGIGGLTAALALARQGVPCRVLEAAEAFRPLGVGINLLPHATAILQDLGVLADLERIAIATREACFYTRHGQLVLAEPCGRFAGLATPQLSIHRGDLQVALLEAARVRLGADRILAGHRVTGFAQDEAGVTIFSVDPQGRARAPVRGAALIACDGINSTIRAALNPDEGQPSYAGINMWRGVTYAPPFLTGASYLRIGTLRTGKMVIYPIRDDADGRGHQLVNWVVEIERDDWQANDWNRPGRLEDFAALYEDWRFDWLDVPDLLRRAHQIFEYPMVDRDPLARWTHGRATLLGDAAHPMYPRGANGAAQAILDARALADALARENDVPAALHAYEDARRDAANRVVRSNRSVPPDTVIALVEERTGGRPFRTLDDVIGRDELQAVLDEYRRITAAVPDGAA